MEHFCIFGKMALYGGSEISFVQVEEAAGKVTAYVRPSSQL